MQGAFKEKKPVSIEIETPCCQKMNKSQRTLPKSFVISRKTILNCSH